MTHQFAIKHRLPSISYTGWSRIVCQSFAMIAPEKQATLIRNARATFKQVKYNCFLKSPLIALLQKCPILVRILYHYKNGY